MARFASCITIQRLKEIIFECLQKSQGCGADYDDIQDVETYFHIYGLLDMCGKLKSDLEKINFDCENFSIDPDDDFGCSKNGLVGYHTFNNGFTFVGCLAGGDWEMPIFFIIYYDGKDLRGYIPESGNTFNPFYRTAYGSEEEAKDPVASRAKMAPNDIQKIFPLVDIITITQALYNPNENYILDKMREWASDIEWNWVEIEKDIMRRIAISKE